MHVASLNDSVVPEELRVECENLVAGRDRYIPTIVVDVSSLGGRSPLEGQLWLARVVAALEEDESLGQPLLPSTALESFITEVVSSVQGGGRGEEGGEEEVCLSTISEHSEVPTSTAIEIPTPSQMFIMSGDQAKCSLRADTRPNVHYGRTPGQMFITGGVLVLVAD